MGCFCETHGDREYQMFPDPARVQATIKRERLLETSGRYFPPAACREVADTIWDLTTLRMLRRSLRNYINA